MSIGATPKPLAPLHPRSDTNITRALPVDPAGRRLPDPPDRADRERREPRRVSLHRRAPFSRQLLLAWLDRVHEARFLEAPVAIVPCIPARSCGRDAAPPGRLAAWRQHPSSPGGCGSFMQQPSRLAWSSRRRRTLILLLAVVVVARPPMGLGLHGAAAASRRGREPQGRCLHT